MKTFSYMALLLGVVVLGAGCAEARLGKFDPLSTPAYSSSERGDLIAHSMRTDWQEAQDDIDEVLMLRPSSKMTIWHVR